MIQDSLGLMMNLSEENEEVKASEDLEHRAEGIL